MFGLPQPPLDRFPYSKAASSRPISLTDESGLYVYVVDLSQTIHIAPDGSHMHPKVLANAETALYAGDLSIISPGLIDEVTNLSGTFQFDDEDALCTVYHKLCDLGFVVRNVIWHDWQNGGRPRKLTC